MQTEPCPAIRSSTNCGWPLWNSTPLATILLNRSLALSALLYLCSAKAIKNSASRGSAKSFPFHFGLGELFEIFRLVRLADQLRIPCRDQGIETRRDPVNALKMTRKSVSLWRKLFQHQALFVYLHHVFQVHMKHVADSPAAARFRNGPRDDFIGTCPGVDGLDAGKALLE